MFEWKVRIWAVLVKEGVEVCELLRRNEDICCLQKVRWRVQGTHFMRVKRRRYKFWWSKNHGKTGGVVIMVKEELCENVMKV